ncbi:MAG: hypothetical protein H6654_04175 [Ardenticatenaceae bacterium]|nr:hypothetical protein [Anaerolineales bacterium]MCB8941375.1 hypothetical protein [Ardenticatenaceae bacterium]MCB8972731.1 hypothetical protein [Ardenticatenaceae bacterium]
MTKKITLELSNTDYSLIKQIADACKWPVEEVVVQCIRSGMPPSLSKVPEVFHEELLSLNALSDKALMSVVDGKLPPPEKTGDLYTKADYVSLRRTYALSLLRWRGHPIEHYELF